MISFFSFGCSQNKTEDYKDEVKELRKFVDNAYKKDSTKVEAYARKSENGKIFRIKSNDIYTEFNFEVSDVYSFLKMNSKIVFIRKEPISQSGDSFYFYEYYFNENGRLIGAEKSVSTFYGEESDIIRYKVEYLLNSKTDKLERVNEYYSDIDGKKIDPKLKKYKEAFGGSGLIENYIEYLDKITFRDLEGFIKVEKIKYYK